MALCLEAIVLILPPEDAIAMSIPMVVLTAAAQCKRWRSRQRQGGGNNDGTQYREPELVHQRAPLGRFRQLDRHLLHETTVDKR